MGENPETYNHLTLGIPSHGKWHIWLILQLCEYLIPS